MDRYLGLVLQVIHHTSQTRAIPLNEQDQEDLCHEVFLALLKDDFAVLRRFKGESSLATYLTVICRRIIVRELLKKKPIQTSESELENVAEASDFEQRIEDQQEVEELLRQLTSSDADVVRMYHLEGKSYQEISEELGMAAGSIGPLLSRARAKIRDGSPEHTG